MPVGELLCASSCAGVARVLCWCSSALSSWRSVRAGRGPSDHAAGECARAVFCDELVLRLLLLLLLLLRCLVLRCLRLESLELDLLRRLPLRLRFVLARCFVELVAHDVGLDPDCWRVCSSLPVGGMLPDGFGFTVPRGKGDVAFDGNLKSLCLHVSWNGLAGPVATWLPMVYSVLWTVAVAVNGLVLSLGDL